MARKQTKAQHYTAQQNKRFAAYKKAHPQPKQTTHQFQQQHRKGRQVPGKAGKPAKAVAPYAAGTDWPLMRNDELETCTLATLASSLWLETGIWAGDELAEAGEGMCILEAAEAITSAGLPGVMSLELLEIPGALGGALPGTIVIMTLPDGQPHAALSLGDGMMASWGSTAPLEGEIEAAWIPVWEG